MALTRLLDQALTIRRRQAGALDEHGNEVTETVSSTTVDGYLEQTAETELVVDRETYTSDWLCVLPASTDIDAGDQVVFGGATFEVLGPPARRWNPRTAATSHVECRLRATTG